MTFAPSTSRGSSLQEFSPEQVAFVELEVPKTHFFVNELIPVTVRFGIEESFRNEKLIQLFHRRLDLPVQLSGDLLESSPDLRELSFENDTGGAIRVRFADNDELVEATAEEIPRSGKSFFTVTRRRSLTASRAGEFSLNPITLRFAYATEFEDDLFEGRVPGNRFESSLGSASPTLTIVPFPEPVPEDFGGAVGEFTVTAEASSTLVEVGEHFELTLSWEGSGNLESWDPPELAVAGFHRFGQIAEVLGSVRTVTYDLAATRIVSELGPLSWTVLEPTDPPAYRTLEIPALAVRSIPPVGDRGVASVADKGPDSLATAGENALAPPEGRLTPSSAAPSSPKDSARDPSTPPALDEFASESGFPPGSAADSGAKEATPESSLFGKRPWLFGLIAIGVGFLGVVLARRPKATSATTTSLTPATRSRPASPTANLGQTSPMRSATPVRVEAPSNPDAADRLALAIAKHLDCEWPSVIGPHLRSRLVAHGTPEGLARQASEAMESLLAPRYGGPVSSWSEADVNSLIEQFGAAPQAPRSER